VIMQVEEVDAVLSDMIAQHAVEIDVVGAARQLEDCFIVLRRETAFKPVPPGEPDPLVSYELVQARDSVESAIGALAVLDVAKALEKCSVALSNVQHALRQKNYS
jgi:hypothetical protein